MSKEMHTSKPLKVTIERGKRVVVKMRQPQGFIVDEWIVLEEAPELVKIQGMKLGILWIEQDFIDQNVRILTMLPLRKMTVRERIKFWILKHA